MEKSKEQLYKYKVTNQTKHHKSLGLQILAIVDLKYKLNKNQKNLFVSIIF